MSLLLSHEIVATNISYDSNGSARAEVGVVGRATMNASCSELGGLMIGGGWTVVYRYVPGALGSIIGGDL